jgi:hypothetical protein
VEAGESLKVVMLQSFEVDETVEGGTLSWDKDHVAIVSGFANDANLRESDEILRCLQETGASVNKQVNLPDLKAELDSILWSEIQPDQHLEMDFTNLSECIEMVDSQGVLVDGSVVKRNVITKTYLRSTPEEDTRPIGSEPLSAQAVAVILINEHVLHLKPGVTEPFSEAVQLHTSAQTFAGCLSNGAVAKKQVETTVASLKTSLLEGGFTLQRDLHRGVAVLDYTCCVVWVLCLG